MSKKKINIGIIGSGFGVYGLIPAFAHTPGCKVVAYAGNLSERALGTCLKYAVLNKYSLWKDMIDSTDLDAVAIAVKPSAQYEIAMYALQKGLHVFAEKPLTSTYLEAENLYSEAIKRKCKTAVDFIFPEIPEFEALKKYMQTNKVGSINSVNLEWDFLSYDIKNKKKSWKTNAKEGGGALAFYFSHSLFYLEWLLGKISINSSKLTYSNESLGGAEVGVDITFTTKELGKGKAHILCNNKVNSKHILKITGSEGSLLLQNTTESFPNFRLYFYNTNKKKINIKTSSLSEITDEDKRVPLIRKMSTKFINAIKKDSIMYPSFKEGSRVQQLIETIRLKSSANIK